MRTSGQPSRRGWTDTAAKTPNDGSGNCSDVCNPQSPDARIPPPARGARSDARVDTLVCDFASLDAVRTLARQVRSTYDRIDVLIKNAGGVFAHRTETIDAYESTFAVNHLGGYLLTKLLEDLVVASAPSRIVMVSSTGHQWGTMDFDDLGYRRGYSMMKAYNRSKLANVLYARSLEHELSGTSVTVIALHPGTVATNIWDGAPPLLRSILALVKRRLW